MRVASVSRMPLTRDQINELDDRARETGKQIGCDLRFTVAANPEFVGLSAQIGDSRVIVLGPAKLSDLAAHDVDLTLDDLAAGRRTIILDEDGDPRLI